jgi:metallo-beta-lactamase class B
MQEGGQNPFVDPDGYKKFVALREGDFRHELAKQKAATSPSARPK